MSTLTAPAPKTPFETREVETIPAELPLDIEEEMEDLSCDDETLQRLGYNPNRCRPVVAEAGQLERRLVNLLLQIPHMQAIHQLNIFKEPKTPTRIPDVVAYWDHIPATSVFYLSKHGSPFVLIEIVSEKEKDRRRDLINKPTVYAGWGVEVLLVLDRFKKNIHLFFHDGRESIIYRANGIRYLIRDQLEIAWDGTVNGCRLWWEGKELLEVSQTDYEASLKAKAASDLREIQALNAEAKAKKEKEAALAGKAEADLREIQALNAEAKAKKEKEAALAGKAEADLREQQALAAKAAADLREKQALLEKQQAEAKLKQLLELMTAQGIEIPQIP